LKFSSINHCIQPSTGVGLEKCVGYSSSLGAIGPPAAAICSLNACRIFGSVEILGSISSTDSMSIARLLALCLEPIIE